MAGRRFKAAVLSELASVGVKYAVVSSLANSYCSYLATREEYAKQWYEGAATQFGPHQQAAFQQEYVKLCRAILGGDEVPPGPRPPDVTGQTVNFAPKVWFDDVPLGKRFGDVHQAPKPKYARGDVVVAQFWGGHPNNNYRTQDTFLTVERLVGDAFVPVARDWDPETTYRWERRGLACSLITIAWDTRRAEPGTYRIRHTGDRKSLTGKIQPYEGMTETFSVEEELARSVRRSERTAAAVAE
jgi:neutral ceramidase